MGNDTNNTEKYNKKTEAEKEISWSNDQYLGLYMLMQHGLYQEEIDS